MGSGPWSLPTGSPAPCKAGPCRSSVLADVEPRIPLVEGLADSMPWVRVVVVSGEIRVGFDGVVHGAPRPAVRLPSLEWSVDCIRASRAPGLSSTRPAGSTPRSGAGACDRRKPGGPLGKAPAGGRRPRAGPGSRPADPARGRSPLRGAGPPLPGARGRPRRADVGSRRMRSTGAGDLLRSSGRSTVNPSSSSRPAYSGSRGTPR